MELLRQKFKVVWPKPEWKGLKREREGEREREKKREKERKRETSKLTVFKLFSVQILTTEFLIATITTWARKSLCQLKILY